MSYTERSLYTDPETGMRRNMLRVLYGTCVGVDDSEPVKTKKIFNPEKEWKKVKEAWAGDYRAWERYTGYRLFVD